jgi:hypothetical protein
MSRMVELYLHTPYVFKAWCLIKHEDNFTLPIHETADPVGRSAEIIVVGV